MEWFRMYHGVLNDPKVHRLTIVRRWRWVEVLCVASAAKERGRLPSLDDLAFHMRVKRQEAESIVNDLIRVGLVDQSQDGKELTVHDWDEHQKPSDSSAQRVRDFRERQRNVTGNSDVTLQETLTSRCVTVPSALARDSDLDKTKSLLTSEASLDNPPASTLASEKPVRSRRAANPCPAPPDVVANDLAFQRIMAEEERQRRAESNGPP